MPTLIVDAPDGIDGNGFSFEALGEIDFVNGWLVSSTSMDKVFEFDDDLSVMVAGTFLDGLTEIYSISIYQGGDPLVTILGGGYTSPVLDTILAGGVAGLIAELMSTGDAWGGGHNFYGSQQGDVLYGSDGSDVIEGHAGDDVLIAGEDRLDFWLGTPIEIQDTLDGGAGDDMLWAYANGDTVTGGAGADMFVVATNLWTYSAKTATVIMDFSSAEGDKIDLSPMGGEGYDFTFIGTAAFTGTGAWEVRYGVSGDGVWISLDGDGDGLSDDVFTLIGVTSLQASDFIL